MDWTKIRNEYITTHTSYRKLAEKHGVSFNTLKTIAIKEKWNELRQQTNTKQTTKTIEKISDFSSDINAEIIKLSVEIKKKALKRINENIDKINIKDIKDLNGLGKLVTDMSSVNTGNNCDDSTNDKLDKIASNIKELVNG